MESKGNEIIISKNDGQYSFNRVDFNDYASILGYGSEILQQIEEASIVHAKLLESQGGTESLDDELKSIRNFSEQVGRVEVKNGKQKEEKGLRKIGSLWGSIRRKSKEYLDTDFISFENYEEDLKKIRNMMEKRQGEVLKSITQNSDFKKIMNPLVALLKLLIEVGEEDLEEYRLNVLKPRKEAYDANPSDAGLARAYHESDLISNVFEETLIELKKGLAQCEITLTEMEEATKPKMTLVRQYNSYTRISHPFMLLQGSTMVGNQRDRAKINEYLQVVDVTDEVFSKNSQMLLANVEDSIELEKRGSMSVEAIREAADVLNQCIQLHESSLKEIQQIRQKDLADLSAIIEQTAVARQRIGALAIDGQEIGAVYDKRALPKTRRRGRK